MPSLPLIGMTPFLLFMKAEVDYATLINENTATTAEEDFGNGLLIICAIREAARKWQNIPEELKLYFSRRAKSINKGAHIPNPNKKVENDIIRELGGQTGFFATILKYRVDWFQENFEKKTMGWEILELYIYWNQCSKKDRKRFHKMWKAHNPD